MASAGIWGWSFKCYRSLSFRGLHPQTCRLREMNVWVLLTVALAANHGKMIIEQSDVNISAVSIADG